MKIKNIAIYIVFCIIIFTSLKIPKMLVKIEDNQIKSEIYERKNNQISIDVEAEKIHLVKVIHARNTYPLAINEQDPGEGLFNENQMPTEKLDENWKNEIEKLKELEIIKNIEISNELEGKAIDMEYNTEEDTFMICNIYMGSEVIEIEEKTGKIISIVSENANYINKELEREELLRRYIQYLELYVIDDWKFENNVLKSEKAKLVVYIEENGGVWQLLINGAEAREIEEKLKNN